MRLRTALEEKKRRKGGDSEEDAKMSQGTFKLDEVDEGVLNVNQQISGQGATNWFEAYGQLHEELVVRLVMHMTSWSTSINVGRHSLKGSCREACKYRQDMLAARQA